MAAHIYEYFASLNLLIQEAYGMSETTGLSTWNLPEAFSFGTVGWPCAGLQVEVFKCDDKDFSKKTRCPEARDLSQPTEEEQGEICFRGRTVMTGYLCNPAIPGNKEEIEKKNAETIDKEGWLHSGDKGCRGANGLLRITGRYKELIISAGGENIAPVGVEDNVKKLCPALSNVMMVGDKRKFNVMLVTLKCKGANGEFPGTDELDGAAKEVDPECTTIAQAKESQKWKDYITAGITGTNKNPVICQNNAWAVQYFAILDRDFSVETGEFTATLKLKRSVAEKTFLKEIEALYAGK
jgi:long-chain-fatty-acid--CoA ligase ACSBG